MPPPPDSWYGCSVPHRQPLPPVMVKPSRTVDSVSSPMKTTTLARVEDFGSEDMRMVVLSGPPVALRATAFPLKSIGSTISWTPGLTRISSPSLPASMAAWIAPKSSGTRIVSARPRAEQTKHTAQTHTRKLDIALPARARAAPITRSTRLRLEPDGTATRPGRTGSPEAGATTSTPTTTRWPRESYDRTDRTRSSRAARNRRAPRFCRCRPPPRRCRRGCLASRPRSTN